LLSQTPAKRTGAKTALAIPKGRDHRSSSMTGMVKRRGRSKGSSRIRKQSLQHDCSCLANNRSDTSPKKGQFEWQRMYLLKMLGVLNNFILLGRNWRNWNAIWCVHNWEKVLKYNCLRVEKELCCSKQFFLDDDLYTLQPH
jgi:hypothetical protein